MGVRGLDRLAVRGAAAALLLGIACARATDSQVEELSPLGAEGDASARADELSGSLTDAVAPAGDLAREDDAQSAALSDASPPDASPPDARPVDCRTNRTVNGVSTTIDCSGLSGDATCTCEMNGALVETCTSTSATPCGTGNCCGF